VSSLFRGGMTRTFIRRLHVPSEEPEMDWRKIAWEIREKHIKEIKEKQEKHAEDIKELYVALVKEKDKRLDEKDRLKEEIKQNVTYF
jgi:hypothetical protein